MILPQARSARDGDRPCGLQQGRSIISYWIALYDYIICYIITVHCIMLDYIIL